MSALGHKRTLFDYLKMSAFGRKADISHADTNRFLHPLFRLLKPADFRDCYSAITGGFPIGRPNFAANLPLLCPAP